MAAAVVNVLVVYCHPESGVVRRRRPRSRASPRSSDARPRRARHRPVRRRLRPVLRRRRPAHPPRARVSTPALAALRRRSALVRLAGARLPDVVERAAGDAQGLDRPGVGRTASRGSSRRVPTVLRPLLRNVRRIVVVTTHGSSKLRQRGRRAKAGKRIVTRAAAVAVQPLDAAPRGSRCTASTRRPPTSAPRSSIASTATRDAVRLVRRRQAAGDGDGDLGGDRGVVLGQREVGRDAAAIGRLGDAAEHERRDRRPDDARPRRSRRAPGRARRRARAGRARRLRGSARPTSTPGRRPRAMASTAATSAAVSTRCGTRQPRRPGVERREPVVPPAEHRHADGLEVLERARQVEERLRPGTHRDDRVMGQRVEVGADVAGELGPAVHAADAAGGEHRDAGGGGERHRRRHGRRAELPLAGRPRPRGRARPPCAPARGSARARRRRARPGRRRRAPRSPPGPRRLRGSPRAAVERLARWPATAGRGWRRSSTRGRRPARRRRSAAATSSDRSGGSRLSLPARRRRRVPVTGDEPGDRLDVVRLGNRSSTSVPIVAVPVRRPAASRRERATPGRS